MMGDVASPSSGDPFGKRKDRNNEIFRSIMNSKSQEGLNVLDDEGNPPLGDRDDDFGLSGSWDDIPLLNSLETRNEKLHKWNRMKLTTNFIQFVRTETQIFKRCH